MGKAIKLLLLFCLLALIVTGALLQTPYAKEKIKTWLEEKTELEIGSLTGFIPFWVQLKEVRYQDHITLDSARITFSPLTFITGRFEIVHAQVKGAKITYAPQAGGGWPTFPIPIQIHSFKIHNLTYNGFENLTLSGHGELNEDFSAYLKLDYKGLSSTLNLVGEAKTHEISLISHIQIPDFNLWLSGKFAWDTQTFLGSLHADLLSYEVLGDVVLTDQKKLSVTFTSTSPFSEGTLVYDVNTHQFSTAGSLFETPVALEGRLQWEENALAFQLNILGIKGPTFAYEAFPPVDLIATGRLTRDRLFLDGKIHGISSAPLTVTADIPLPQGTPFTLKFKGRGSIDPVLSFLENASLIARGNLDLDLTLSGSWENPTLAGHIIYSEGWIESLATGALFRDIHVELEGVGNQLQVRHFIAHDTGRGDLSGTGSILWSPEQGFPFAFNVFTSQFALLTVDPFTATVDSNLDISGNIHEMSIVGSAELTEAHLAIPNRMPVRVPVVEVTYVNPLPTTELVEHEISLIPIYLDIHIEAPRQLTIEGRGLFSEWGGSMHLTGEQNALQYSGKLKLVQGRFEILNRSFDLTEGKIVIEGIEPKDIYIDLKGDYELPTMTASILLEGSLDDTNFSFTSTPPMNTNQILSWILFNQDINELTPLQACRLANIIVSLSGKYQGPRFFDRIKQGLGIDVFSITRCDIDTADLSFQVGKYLSQGTFVGVNKSLSGEFDSVSIQTRLYRNFYLEGDYGGSLNGLTPNGGKAIFKWYRTY